MKGTLLPGAGALLAFMACLGCQEPSKIPQMEALVASLADLAQWDPIMQGKGHMSYESVMGYGPEIYPILVGHLTDETTTGITDEVSHRNPKISDVAFLMLLELTKMKWQDFASDGVFVSTALPNPVFCVKWDRPAKFKVQAHFRTLLEIKKPA